MTALGLKPPPRHAPRRLQSTADLRRFQRLMLHALVRPLGPDDGAPAQWFDGRTTAEVAAEFIKPNDRLTAVDRLEIYQRMYWYRLIDSVGDDSPGLRAVMGEVAFDRLVRAYLAKYPSRSFTLRNLCSRLPQFLAEERRWTAPRTALALTVARFEWAQTVAFDGEQRPALSAAEIARTPAHRLRVDLQPYLSLLQLDFPVDNYVIAVKKRDALRAEASNARERALPLKRHRSRRVPLPHRQRIHLAVYRLKMRLYYKRVVPAEYRILNALRAGQPIAEAVAAGGGRVRPRDVQEWFATWMKLGWLCLRK
jgi:hypothetical protein